jgi:hypothetical protein
MAKEDELRNLAIDLIQRENKTEWRAEVGYPEHKEGTIWLVLVRWISPNGDPLDGPGVIYVDEESREAWGVETC